MIFTARKNLKLEVSERQLQILVGCLLGDAYLTKLGKIQIEQSYKQEEYIKWKHQELASISYTNLKKAVRFEKTDNRVTKSFRFWTRQYFRIWRKYFYRENCKIFPKELNRWITPLSIAVWYMDDGSFDHKFNCSFSTESFDLESKELLVEKLKSFELETILTKSGKLRVRSRSLPKFFELVRPYIHKNMLYKLP